VQPALQKLYGSLTERGIVTAANVVDHIVPHKGDWTAFVTQAAKSLRAVPQVGDAANRAAGYRCDVGIDGFPTDPYQPFNRAR
jgi:hypothetical protein